MFIGAYNWIDSATLSGGSWTDLDNVKDRDLYDVARSTDATAVNTKMNIDLGSSRTIQAISLHAHNLSQNATVTITAGTLVGGTNLLNSTNDAVYSLTFDDTKLFSDHYDYILSTNFTGQYITIEITDTGNGDGYVDIGRVGVWTGVDPTYECNWGIEHGMDDTSPHTVSKGDNFLFDQRVRKRTVRLTHDLVVDTERDIMHEILRSVGETGEILFSALEGQQYSFLGRMKKLSALQRTITNINSTQYELREL